YLLGKLDITGHPVSEVISQTQNGVLITKSFEKYGLEKKGKVLIPYMYDNLSYWGEDKYIAQKDNKFGIIDSHNKVLLNFEYSSITPLKEGKSTIKRGTSQNEIDSNLKIVEDLVIELQEGYKKIKLGGKWGILNPEGQVIVDYLYDEISTFRGRLVGIINGRLIKLNAYYPYRLVMKAKNIGIVDSRDLISSGGVKFQNLNRRNNPKKGQEESIILLNWTSSMKFPIVHLYDKDKHNKRAKHIDKPTDFTIGDTFEVTVKSIIKGYGVAKEKIKGVEIELSNGMKSYIFKKDFATSGIDIAKVTLDDKFSVTKLGYDEELDRTQWKVSCK
ncbi:MAG: WG repeat-containing protein, partial [Muribaculaceae bacterium]|nr:WG repeat-containing protein [Muribaculaceae bacterium]